MNSPEEEGVIKFRLDYRHVAEADFEVSPGLIAWRTLCCRLGIMGQSPDRYGGLGFGNLSQRIDSVRPGGGSPRFVVSGTQTGGLETVSRDHFCRVTGFVASENRIEADGPVKPSSEALTHGAVYASDPRIRFVIHVHSPEIWNSHEKLGIAATPSGVRYGTPGMARSVEEIVAASAYTLPGILVMSGHEDGVISYAETIEGAGQILVEHLAAALALSGQDPQGN